MHREEAQPVARHAAQPHRGGEAAQQRGHRRRRHVVEDEALLGAFEQQRAGAGLRGVLAVQPRRQRRAVRAEQPHGDRDRHRLLVRLPGRRRGLLLQRQRDSAASPGRSCRSMVSSGVPAWSYQRVEGGQVDARRVLHRARRNPRSSPPGCRGGRCRGPCRAGRRRAPMQRVHHAAPPRRPSGRRSRCRNCRSRYSCPAAPDAPSARHPRGTAPRAGRARRRCRFTARLPMVGREFLVAEDGQAFLQRQLEPVAAGDAVAGPVVEILVRDDGLDALRNRRRSRVSGLASTYCVLKTLRPLFSIAPMLKSRHGDDVEDVEIVFEAEDLLVPAHRLLQRRPSRGRIRPRRRARTQMRSATSRPERVVKRSRDRDQVAGDEREQVGRLRVRVDPLGPMPPAPPHRRSPTGLPFDSSTGKRALSARDRHRVARHHVGPVGEDR